MARFVCRHPKPVIFFSILLTLGGVYLTVFQLGVINDTNALIRQDSPALRNFLTYVKEFNAADPLVIMIQSPDFEQNRQAVEALAKKVASRPGEIQTVYYRNDLSRLKPHFLLYEDKAKLEEILKQIRAQSGLLQGKSGGGVNLNSLLAEALNQFDRVEKAKGKRGTLDDLGSFADRMIKDLEQLADKLAKPVNESAAPAIAKSKEEQEFDDQLLLNTYLAFDNGKLLLMMLTPGEGDKNSFSPQETTIRNLRHDIDEMKKLYPHVSIGLTGEPVLLDDELKASTNDMTIASILAFILISGLFFFAYREFKRPALAIFCLVSALFWSLGFAVLVIGHLNIISQAFVLMLLGLGIDFGIQILGRYEEERAEGKDAFRAIEEVVQFTGTAVVTGGGITAIAFFTMCFNDFLGLAELGVIAGAGMIFCMAANLILLPALLAWRDAGRKLSLPEHHYKHAALGRKLDDLLQARPWLSLTVVAAITVVAVIQARKVEFDHNLLNLQNPAIESVRLAKQLLNSPANSFLFGVVVAKDLDDAKKKTATLESLPTVRDVSSPIKILPENQEEKLKILSEIRTELNQIKFNPDVSMEVNVAQAQEHLQTLLEYSRKGLAGAGKFRQAKDPRAQQAFDIFDRLIPALEKSVESLRSLSQEEAGKRLNRFQMEIFMQMQQQFNFLKSFDMETPVGLDALPPEALRHYVSPNNKILLEVHPKE
ncbi:MAG: MMPL family transporter, partial [bacterium]